MTIDEDGSIFLADTSNQRIRRIDSNGTITTVAGTGISGYAGDGGAPLSARLNYPTGLALDGDTLYIADTLNHRIRMVDLAQNVIHTLAGSIRDYGGDGGPAIDATLAEPTDLAIVPGGLLVADKSNCIIRRIDLTFLTIDTVAGSPLVCGNAGDGGPALEAQLSYPYGISVQLEDTSVSSYSILIADTANHRIRMVDPEGLMTTLAGSGKYGYSGDGGNASEASLYLPTSVEYVPQSGWYIISDMANERLRAISPEGIIDSIAGTGKAGFNGDGKSASTTQISDPTDLLVTEDRLTFVDNGNQRIRSFMLHYQ